LDLSPVRTGLSTLGRVAPKRRRLIRLLIISLSNDSDLERVAYLRSEGVEAVNPEKLEISPSNRA